MKRGEDERVAPSLGIDDEDASYLIGDIDRAFGVNDPGDRGPTLWTVGDYYDWLIAELDARPTGRRLDAPARLFMQLRPTLERETGIAHLRPSTRLRDLWPEPRFDRMLAAVIKPLNLTTRSQRWHRSASIPFGTAWFIGIGAVIAGAFGVPFAWHAFGLAIALGLAGLIARRLRGPDLSDSTLTVAWLMRRLAADNYRKLASAPHDSREVWNTLTELLGAGSFPQGPIGRETRLVADVDFFARSKESITD